MVGRTSVIVYGRPRSQYLGDWRLRYNRQPVIQQNGSVVPQSFWLVYISIATKMSNNTASRIYIDDLMTNLMDLDGFIRMDYEKEFPDFLPPPATHRPPPLTDEQINEKGEAYWTYPLRLKHYEEKCYIAFEAWNRRYVESMNNTALNHLSWVCEKIATGQLKLMDEESGACFETHGFFFDQNKNLVFTNPR